MLRRWFHVLASTTLLLQLVVGSGGSTATAAPAAAPAAAPRAAPAAAASAYLHLKVMAANNTWNNAGSVHKGDPVPTYRWLLSFDDTGNPYDSLQNCQPWRFNPPTNTNYPNGCTWPSVENVMPGTTVGFFSQGDNATLSQTVSIDPNSLGGGKWFIQVSADGYRQAGGYFTTTCGASGCTVSSDPVLVQLEPTPLPTTTVRVKVFNDILTNGEYDVPGEPGLQGFVAHLADRGAEVTTDFYGNPLCTQYATDANGHVLMTTDAFGSRVPQSITKQGGKCISDANGDVVIPNLGPDKYAVSVVPPDGSNWVQTSTLEGSLEWDTWRAEGETGYKTEPIDVGEAEPEVTMGFVQPQWLPGYTNVPVAPLGGVPGSPGHSGGIKGQVMGLVGYSPPAGGLVFGSEAGNKLSGPVASPWIALSSLQLGDTLIFVGRGNPDGTFNVQGLADGDYVLAAWDNDLNMLMEAEEVTVIGGQITDMGVFYVLHWFGTTEGRLCVDLNLDGKCEPNEPGIPNQPVNILNRDNSLFEDGSNSASTDSDGHYIFRQTYELNDWVVEQVYLEHYKTIGVTYQTDSQPNETTVLGAGVDLNLYTLVGGHARIDWALAPYAPGTNGGIVGEMVYNSTRLEPDPNVIGAPFPQEGGIPNMVVNLYRPVFCTDSSIAPTAPCETNPVDGLSYKLAADGSYMKAPLLDGSGNPVLDPNGNPVPWVLNTYTSETWARPQNTHISDPTNPGYPGEWCTARDVLGNPTTFPFLPTNADGSPTHYGKRANAGDTSPSGAPLVPDSSNADCIPSFAYGEQVITDFATSGNTTVNGNYGFVSIATDQHGNPASDPLPTGDYIVEPQSPPDALAINAAGVSMPLYVPTMEEDVNNFSGPPVIPQLPPMPCAGPQHTVHVVGDQSHAHFDPTDAANPTKTGVYNPAFLAHGGSPYEGQLRHLCGDKIVSVHPGRSVTPNFYWHTLTDIHPPARMRGVVTDDINLSADPNETMYGEKAGIPLLPMGIYDFYGQLITTVRTDPNGIYETLVPGAILTNCPNPSSTCPSVYRVVANDPGQPGHINPDYQPQYRVLVANFDVWPNNTLLYADLAPMPVSLALEGPPNQALHPAMCQLDATQPQVWAVSTPYINGHGQIVITGQGFGSTPGRLLLDRSVIDEVDSWTDRQISFGINTDPGEGPPFAPGAYQLTVVAANGLASINGLSIHVLGNGYSPTVFNVGPGKSYRTIQSALEAATPVTQALVVVWPGTQGTDNPLGAYWENIVMHSPVKLQGVGSGGVYPDGTLVPGSVIDGKYFETAPGRATAWRALLAGLTWSGNQTVQENQVVYVLSTDPQWTSGNPARIDGLQIQGGDQLAFPTNLNDNGGDPLPLSEREGAEVLAQGGGIFVNAYAHYLRISNNVILSNSGTYGGAIRVGTPFIGDNHNDNISIQHNRIIANGGTSLAGAVGLFNGTTSYDLSWNQVCGNYAAEYGGGVSHYGSSPGGAIHDNLIYDNGAYDHGGGIIVAGEAPTSPATTLSAGTGKFSIYNNVIQANISNDDGGGIALEQLNLNSPGTVYNNFIVNNVSTHQGGGVALDDAPDVVFDSNTVMKNLTTGTSFHGNGAAEPAGLSTVANSLLLQQKLPANAPKFSNPLLFNNIFYDNRSGHWTFDSLNVTGIGQTGDTTPINYWDLGPADCPQAVNCGEALSPTSSILTTQQPAGSSVQSATNKIGNAAANYPQVKSLYDTGINLLPWRGDPHFVGTVTVGIDEPAIRMGDYHLASNASPAYNLGAASKSGVNAPSFDIDYDVRPSHGGFDSGADQIGPRDSEDTFAGPPVLDNFNRANGPLNSGTTNNWTGLTSSFQILSNAVQVARNGFLIWSGNTPGSQGQSFGANQSAYFTFKNVLQTATHQDLILKAGVAAAGSTTIPALSFLDVQYDATKHAVNVNSFALNVAQFLANPKVNFPWVAQYTIPNVTFRIGDRFGVRTFDDGSVYVYQNGRPIGAVNITTTANPWPAASAKAGGRIGVFYDSPSYPGASVTEFDDFGGGTLP